MDDVNKYLAETDRLIGLMTRATQGDVDRALDLYHESLDFMDDPIGDTTFVEITLPVGETTKIVGFNMSGSLDTYDESEKVTKFYQSINVGRLSDILESILPDVDDLRGMRIEYIREMAGRIPGLTQLPGKSKREGLIIAMGDQERSLQHFHVFRNDLDKQNWRNGACLLFKENRYYDHGRNTATLDEDELISVVNKLKDQHPSLKISNWKYLAILWNDNNHGFPLDPNLPMPDYDYATIKRYKEKKDD